jgi:CheY-like chemotaxis protein
MMAHVKALSGMKFLVAEDDDASRRLTQMILCHAGAAEVVGVTTGSEAVERALSGNYDVVFMDLSLPILNGLEAVKMLRRRHYSKPIVALTAREGLTSMAEAAAAGCDAYITKSVKGNTRLKLIRLAKKIVPLVAEYRSFDGTTLGYEMWRGDA